MKNFIKRYGKLTAKATIAISALTYLIIKFIELI
tara:strand:- start:177 stop:278 length:102 start_codon:yes stop_codon:yes gene_type:complete